VLVTLLSLTSAALTGIGGLHLWPQWARVNELSAWVLPILTCAAGLPFVSAVTAMPQRSMAIHKLLVAGTVIGLVCAVFMVWVPVPTRNPLLVTSCVLLPLVSLLTLLWAARRGDRFAFWVALSYLPLLVAAGWAMAPIPGWIPVGFFTMHGVLLAIAFYLPVLLVVLMLRSQHRRENSRRIQGLDRVDPATGLINGHVFAERLARMAARSARLRQNGAVMVIDLMNFDQIQRDFGRKAAEEMPLRVAQRLLSTAREIDSAARLAERRFGMLVEGPFTPDEVAAMGPRIIARCLMPFPGLHVECVAQVRIAYALVPHHNLEAADLVSKLELRLAHAPLSSKRAVFTLNESPPARLQLDETSPDVPASSDALRRKQRMAELKEV
jgi:two-component system, sensor histidine kinase LadS